MRGWPPSLAPPDCALEGSQFDASCHPRLPRGAELVCSHARLDWSTNRYLNAGSDYLRSFGLRRLLDDTADVCMLFGPSLPLVRGSKRVDPESSITAGNHRGRSIRTET